MNEQTLNKQAKKIKQGLNFHFPWISLIASVALVVYYFMLLQPQLIEPYYLIPQVTTTTFQWSVLAVFFYLLVTDILYFIRRQKKLKQAITNLQDEIDDLWQSKKKIQQKAHVFSSHADKLKLFISDKLLEYIEYDEKFLHFKSIAAEVRHNGVISYDKIKTALKHAMTQLESSDASGHISEQNNFQSNSKNSNSDDSQLNDEATTGELSQSQSVLQEQQAISKEVYQQALEAMQYLWDLLDLSTADNIALHIANHIIACEEHYYQQELSKNRPSDTLSLVPFKPSYLPLNAVLNSLQGILERDDYDQLHSRLQVAEASASIIEVDGYRFGFSDTRELLGNQNHSVLLLENLIKNSQYFHGKRSNKQATDKIALQLTQHEGFVDINVYNRGRHIDDDAKEQIFQLGYSTRRAKEHHGKGLGLFFVNEIVKGYEGRIDVTNISNIKQTLTLRMLTSNDVVITKVIHIEEHDGHLAIIEDKPLDQTQVLLPSERAQLGNNNSKSSLNGSSNNDKSAAVLEWEYAVPVVSIEMSETRHETTRTFELDASDKKQVFLDPFNPFMPGWQLTTRKKRDEFKVILSPLDRTGVLFSVKLPDVESRLNDHNPLLQPDFDADVEKLAEQFKEFEEY
ncbi:ATP-binding protein [Pleionea mediterranea]|uniref:histidine kinase n=1 Tax=Pleionea mediterranea TaxID=523701 RepID=A0A316G2A0_9GAMM|nr:ATP-binding protein [Pleionea mediterranea]PWK54525.1 histidine kinase/DNA gyrase B/HSP90-like ATPase [Pleionea mediterranea]